MPKWGRRNSLGLWNWEGRHLQKVKTLVRHSQSLKVGLESSVHWLKKEKEVCPLCLGL